MPDLRVCALYPDLMNIYADRGNLLMLQRRCEWRGIGFELTAAGLGDAIDPTAHDLFYLGGGQDRDQALCAQDLVGTKRDALHAAADGGGLVLGICGGFQLLGHAYELGDEEIPGLGLVDLRTVRVDSHRLVGNVAIEVELDGSARVLAGFENHGGRTHLGPRRAPAGQGPARARQHRRVGLRGRRARRRHRHLPARPAAAEERLVRRLAHRHGAPARSPSPSTTRWRTRRMRRLVERPVWVLVDKLAPSPAQGLLCDRT